MGLGSAAPPGRSEEEKTGVHGLRSLGATCTRGYSPSPRWGETVSRQRWVRVGEVGGWGSGRT